LKEGVVRKTRSRFHAAARSSKPDPSLATLSWCERVSNMDVPLASRRSKAPGSKTALSETLRREVNTREDL
jgi:hypothetical protein